MNRIINLTVLLLLFSCQRLKTKVNYEMRMTFNSDSVFLTHQNWTDTLSLGVYLKGGLLPSYFVDSTEGKVYVNFFDKALLSYDLMTGMKLGEIILDSVELSYLFPKTPNWLKHDGIVYFYTDKKVLVINKTFKNYMVIPFDELVLIDDLSKLKKIGLIMKENCLKFELICLRIDSAYRLYCMPSDFPSINEFVKAEE